MGIKKKLGLGVGAAALGLSLIGGGTFAYFNDSATVHNHFTAGILNFDVQKGESANVNFDLSNLKPGDYATRYFILNNSGSLSIKDILMNSKVTEFTQGRVSDSNTQKNYLKQFTVNFFRVENPSDDPNAWNNRDTLFSNISLYELLTTENINLAPSGLHVGDKDGIGIQITFKDEGNQNIYQGDQVKFDFNLVAHQETGVNVPTNGYIKSNKDNSNPVTTDPTNSPEYTDTTDNPMEVE